MYLQIIHWSGSIVIALVLFLMLKRFKSLPLSLKNLSYLLLSHFIFQLPASYLLKTFGVNTLYYKIVLLIYLIFEFGIFINLFKSKQNKIVISVVFFLGTAAILLGYANSFMDITKLSQAILVNNLMILICCLVYYWTMLKKVSSISIYKQWKFLMVTAFFFYSIVISGTRMVMFIAMAKGEIYFNLNSIKVTIYLVELLIILYAIRVYFKENENPEIKGIVV